jgi:hypothetical protein
MAKFQNVFLIGIYQDGKYISRIYDQNPLVIGRSLEAHVGITDAGVSRLHLELSIKGDVITLVDLGSANGTFVNGQKIPAKTKITCTTNDLIQIGSNKYTVKIDVLEKAINLKDIKSANFPNSHKENLYSMLEAARAEATRMAQVVNSQADQVIKTAEAKAHAMIESAETSARAITEAADAKARVTFQTAEASANSLLQTTEEKIKLMLDAAEAKAKEIGETAERKAVEREKTADVRVQRNIANSEIKAEEIIKNAHVKAEKLIVDADEVIKENKAKAEAIIRDADNIIKNAHTKAESIIGDAEVRLKEAIKGREEATKQRDQILHEAEQTSLRIKEIEESRKNAVVALDQLKNKFEQDKKEFEASIMLVKEQSRKEAEEYRVKEMASIDQLKLEELQKVKSLHKELDQALNANREKLATELLTQMEAHLLAILKPSIPQDFNWAPVNRRIQTEIKTELEELIYKYSKPLNKDSQAETSKQVFEIKRNFKFAAANFAVFFVILMAVPVTREAIINYFKYRGVQVATQEFSSQMKAERDRRYTPDKTPVWKNSFTDSVLYTQGYTDFKLDQKYQDKWIKDLHTYLYTKLRVDENSIVELVSQEAALVSKLKEQAEQIHPDYVNEQVNKMREVEKESVDKMIQIVGSPEKYKKFRKFSEEYYQKEYVDRLPASESK